MLITFMECGWMSWMMLLASLVSLGAALLGGVMALLRIRSAALVLSCLALGAGGLSVALGPVGMTLSRNKVAQALEADSIDPSQRERIRAEGNREALSCVYVGGGLGGPAVLLSVVAATAAYVRKKKDG